MSVVERKNKSGIVFWVANAWKGKQAWERVGTKRREAEVRDRAMKAEIATGEYRPKVGTKALTLGGFAETWGNGRTNANAREERRMLRLYLAPREWLTSKRLADVTHNDIDALVEELKAEKRATGERRLADKTIANFCDVLVQLFKSGLRLGHCSIQPVMIERKTLDRAPAEERQIYSPAEVAVLTRHHAIPWPVRVLNALCSLAGLREGEACGRKWSDLDGDSPILPGLVVRTQYEGRKLKTRRPRIVPVHPELGAVLAAWHAEGFELYTGRKPQPEDFIVPQAGRRSSLKHWGRTTYYKAFIAGARAAGVTPRTLHATRHTFISLCRRNGARKDIVTLITHNPRGDIVDRYTHMDWAPLCEAVLCLTIDAHQSAHQPPGIGGNPGLPALPYGDGSAENLRENANAEQGLVPGTNALTQHESRLAHGPSKSARQGGSGESTVAHLSREERLLRLAEIDPDAARPGLAVTRALAAAHRVGAGESGANAELEAAISHPDALAAVEGW